MFKDIYKGRSVLITGITGFKGSWLAYWLTELGANVSGYSLSCPTDPGHYNILELDVPVVIDDIRNRDSLADAVNKYKPEIVFHLAAQPLVRYSYDNPVETYETNVIGTLNVFEACRKNRDVMAILNITSDKCYENKEWPWGYRENDPMGGYDPYSSSKGCSEILTQSYKESFFNINNYKKTHKTLLASCRAGNVIGGGDWAEDRLIPDIVKAASKNNEVIIRSPKSIRPWQHVLEPLSGYLLLGQKLLEGKREFSGAWNFGPDDDGNVEVEEIVKTMESHWPRVKYKIKQDKNSPHEANMLKLDCSKARSKLKWKPVWDTHTAVTLTTKWYKHYYENGTLATVDDLNLYINDAKEKKVAWSEN